MESVSLEPAGMYPRLGFDAWRADGSFAFRTRYIGRVFQRRAAYFRVNATGKFYRVVSRWKTVEVAARFGSESDLAAGVRTKIIDRPEILS